MIRLYDCNEANIFFFLFKSVNRIVPVGCRHETSLTYIRPIDSPKLLAVTSKDGLRTYKNQN